MTPNKENIAKWVAALRSGKYEQFFGPGLYKNGKFCAMAVGADIIVNPDIPGKYTDEEDFYARMSDITLLTFCGVEEFWIEKNGKLYSLKELNDDMKLSFNEIADLIEAQYLT